MPEIKIQHVVSYSSQDKNNPADNLLKSEGTHKWKCATAGEKSISVVVQLEKASQIYKIDIGNEGSAFVEILVGRSSASSDEDYKVLLVASAFMSPLEARNNTNRNAVRMFSGDNLSKTVAGEKWDRVKIVCTQPFNKMSTYGLSFIKFHSPPGPAETQLKQKTLGFFKMKNGDEGDMHAGSLFEHRNKPSTTPPPLSGAAAVRAASRLAEDSRPSTSTSAVAEKKTSSVKQSASDSAVKLETKVESQKKEQKSTPSPAQNREKRKHNVSDDDTEEEEPPTKPSLPKQRTSLSSTESKDEKPHPLKKHRSEPPKESPAKSFGRIMEKVVFVLSGYQNPYRAELRDRATAMGAIYKPDWGKGCTHLICAFPNTPKYKQVEGRGKIVSQKWIQECYKQKKLLPWRKYRVGDAESPSEDSSSEEEYKPTPKKPTPKKTPKKPSPKAVTHDSDEDDMYGGATDSGEDTEDEIRKAKAGMTKTSHDKGKTKDTSDDPYGADTDEDKPGPSKKRESTPVDTSDSGLPDLPDFFADKKFFFYGKIDNKERRLLTRYITAYDGEIEDYMSDKVHYVVTSSAWDKNFDEALSDNPGLIFVKPKWIHMCHDKSKLMPHQPYIVVPPDS